jgi:hypothetical protein
MKKAIVTLTGMSPYSQSRHYTTDRLNKESARDYEARTWRDKLNVDEEGWVIVPPMALKNCLSEVAIYLSVQIPGKGKSTYTKHIEAGIMVVEPLRLSIKKDDVPGEWQFVPSDGKRGGGKRVDKCFPVIHKWGGVAEYLILDDTVTREVFEYHLKQAGNFIGIGRFRPRKNGFYGRFRVDKIKWQDMETL